MGITEKRYGRWARNPHVTTFICSFETGEQGGYRIYFSHAATIKQIDAYVTKAIAGSDNGTITGANSAGNSANGVLTATASDPLGTHYTCTPTTNNTVGASSASTPANYYTLTSAKNTVGGKVLVTLSYEDS